MLDACTLTGHKRRQKSLFLQAGHTAWLCNRAEERFAVYERAKQAYCVIATGKRRG
jgi:L-fucose mutarotase/ribose pyranase (RbsD/FucU family)